MFSKISKSLPLASSSTCRFLSSLKPTKSLTAAAEPSVSTVHDDGYSTAAAAEQAFLMSNSEAFVETLVSHGKFRRLSL